MCVLCVIFFSVGLLAADYLLTRLQRVAVWEYETTFSTKCFIINSKMTVLCSRNCSAVLTCIYTQVAVYWRVNMTDTHSYLRLISHAPTHIHLWARFFSALPGVLPLHTHTSSCLLEIWLMISTHTHSHTHTALLAPTHIPFMITGTFPLYAYNVTRNLYTYFLSVWRVFLVETLILQTVLWDIFEWSARFIVM